jgi:hypothetical protein
VLALGQALCPEPEAGPGRIFFGTGFGPLSETHDFLQALLSDPQRLASPIDFVGSVHNAPAGQLAMRLGARGANVTATSRDSSFEAALWMAELLAQDVEETEEARARDLLVLGADEHHPVLSPRFDPSSGAPADGGGALWLRLEQDCVPGQAGPGVRLRVCRLAPERPEEVATEVAALVEELGGPSALRERYGALLVDLPAAQRRDGGARLRALVQSAAFPGPVVDLRPLLGEFSSASAVAAVLAVRLVAGGEVPTGLSEGRGPLALGGRGVLLVGLGSHLTAVDFSP